MASCSGTSNGYTLTLTVTQKSQSLASNNSTADWSLKLKAGSKYYQNSSTTDTFKVVIDGTTVYNQAKAIWFNSGNTEITIASGSTTVGHNADGTKSISFSCSYAPGKTASYYPSAMSGSGSMGLTTIPRASSFGTITGNTIGSNLTVNITRNSTAFTHVLWYRMGNTGWVQVASGIGTSHTFAPPMSLCNQIPNNTSGTLELSIRTMNGNTAIGDDVYTSIKVNVPSSVVPSFTFGATRVDNGVPSAFAIYVERFSKVKLDITGAAGSYSSTIKSYSISGAGFSANGSSATFGPFINDSGTHTSFTLTFTATVTDSRGRSTSKTVSITVYDYSSPTLSLKVERCNSAGTVSTSGQYLKITPTYSCSSVNAKNYIASKSFQIKNTSYANTSCASGSSVILGANDILSSNRYEVYAKVTDALGGYAELTGEIGTAEKAINIKSNNKGVCFGGYAVYDNTVHFVWDARFEKNRLLLKDGTAIDLTKLMIFDAIENGVIKFHTIA